MPCRFARHGALLTSLALGALAAGTSLFTRESGPFVDAPTEEFPAAGPFLCSARCQAQKTTACSGFSYGADGICRLYSGGGNCHGTASLPDGGQTHTQRWIRSVCRGTSSNRCACPAGFQRCAGRCLKRLPSAAGTYAIAESRCAAEGAHLAVPRSGFENICAQNMRAGDDMWLGVTDGVAEGQWTGRDGCGAVNPFAVWWKGGEPNNQGDTGNADCVYMHHTGYWADWECPTQSFPFCQLALCYRADCV